MMFIGREPARGRVDQTSDHPSKDVGTLGRNRGTLLGRTATLALAAFALSAGLLASGCHDSAEVAVAPEGVQTAELRVEGTDCASCDVTIRRHLRKLDGVHDIRIGETKQHVIVDFDPKRVSPEQIAQAVLEAGYDAEIFVHSLGSRTPS